MSKIHVSVFQAEVAEIDRKVPKTLLRLGGYSNKLIFFREKPNVMRNRVSSDRKLLENHKKKLESCELVFLAFRLTHFTKHLQRSIVSWTSTQYLNGSS